MDRKCCVISAALVSCQNPLSDDWFENPIIYDETYARAQEPNCKDFITPSEARRMCKILKRTICCALTALNKAGISDPNAVITGTGMGCMENSEKFLIDMAKFGENALKPSLFMQSTHNTIGSLVGIVLKSHGYNNTYSHKDFSFESALLDGWVQLRMGLIRNALVGAHDEVTPFSALVFHRSHPEYKFLSETSMSVVIGAKVENSICEVTDVQIIRNTSPKALAQTISADNDSVLLLGVNGKEMNDTPYKEMLNSLTFTPVTLQYKTIFGENFSASAAGFYAAVRILEYSRVPDFMRFNNDCVVDAEIRKITMIHCSSGSAWSIVRLKAL